MKLLERLYEVKQMAPGWEHYRAMCDVFPALIQVVEQQRTALERLLSSEAKFSPGPWMNARAALAMLDKED